MARQLEWIVPVAAMGLGLLIWKWYRDSQIANDYSVDTSFDPYSPMSLFQPTVPYMMQSTASLNTSQAGRQNIEHWEGRSHNAYLDNGKWAIGVGHDIVPGDGLDQNSVINDATIDAIFANDIDEAENIVKSVVAVPVTQGQFDALVDFAFQFGNKLGHSTLLTRLNNRDYVGAQEEFGKWINVHNSAGQLVQVPQLIDRRAAAQSMFA